MQILNGSVYETILLCSEVRRNVRYIVEGAYVSTQFDEQDMPYSEHFCIRKKSKNVDNITI